LTKQPSSDSIRTVTDCGLYGMDTRVELNIFRGVKREDRKNGTERDININNNEQRGCGYGHGDRDEANETT